jgi:nitrite reductase (NO-forming)
MLAYPFHWKPRRFYGSDNLTQDLVLCAWLQEAVERWKKFAIRYHVPSFWIKGVSSVNVKSTKTNDISLWADTAAGAIRTAFGMIWAIDAFFKWQPDFYNNYLSYITGIVSGQPHWLLPWFNFWVNLIKPDPNLFAWLTRLIETAIAVGLLFGVARKWTYVLGGIFALFIWSIPEGFGGPYTPGATDVGAGLVYVLVFVALLVMDHVLGRSPYSVDFYLEKRFPVWRHVAEWAPAQVLEQEPRRLPWNIQIVAIVAVVILLAVSLAIVTSELNAAATQSSASQIIQMAFLHPLQI